MIFEYIKLICIQISSEVMNKSVGAGLVPTRLEFQTNLYRGLPWVVNNFIQRDNVVLGWMVNIWFSVKFLQALATNAAALIRCLRQQFSRKLLCHTPTLVLFSGACFT
jgi:hypothetical protein